MNTPPIQSTGIQSGVSKRGVVTWRVMAIEEADREFDFHFWQAQSPDARFAAAWELVETAWLIKGRPAHELRLQRSAHHLERLPS